jgi:ribosome maturation factor RimP
MMITEQEIQAIVDEELNGSKLFVVELKVSEGNAIKVLIDGDEGVGIADCKKLSRAIEGSFDREEVDFSLVVSTGGADRPFQFSRQYLKNVGKMVELKLTDNKLIEGKLIEFNNDSLIIEPHINPGKGRRIKILDQKTIDLAQILETKCIIQFK